jgi:hypothetical protein
MPATPEEFQRVVEAFERAHEPLVRALADLHLRGNMILEEHGFLEERLGDQFEEFILASLRSNGSTKEQFAAALRDLDKMHTTWENSTACRKRLIGHVQRLGRRTRLRALEPSWLTAAGGRPQGPGMPMSCRRQAAGLTARSQTL